MTINIGNNIKSARIARHETQVSLADKMGVPQQHISRWESGKVSPTVDTLLAIAKALEIDPWDLLK